MNKALVSSKNVDAVYINGKYQDETMSLNLNEKDIRHHQCMIKITTPDNKTIELSFFSINDLCDFAKAYGLK